MTTTNELPPSQYAVQLVAPNELQLNTAKPVREPGPHEVLVKVEAVGLCFSDLKLLKQFSSHARKSAITTGLDASVLEGIQSYVPGDKPVVPGHEVVCRVVAVGGEVKHHRVGERCLVQTDYRELRTADSNAAFGYNFEGGLQEYVILDERVIIDSSGERFLIPVDDRASASAIALVEPWACVEDSYINPERQEIKGGGQLLIVSDGTRGIDDLRDAFGPSGDPGEVTMCRPDAAGAQHDERFDDIVYFGADADVIETLNDKLAPQGIINIVLGGEKIGRPVRIGVGRVHYGMTRWIGTTGSDPTQSYAQIPADGELREGEKVLVVGAGGPMGQMHVIRDICAGVPGLLIVGTDFDDARLASLTDKAAPLAQINNVKLKLVNPNNTPVDGPFSYFALMAPVPALVASAIAQASPGALINIFAGIPAPTKHEIDLDTYIAKRCFMFGTSGSVIRDMKIVLDKVQTGVLDTNTSVGAVSGMAGATAGIAAIENRTLAGKIIVYPMLHDLGLVPLEELAERYPTVAAKLDNGNWCLGAEQELLAVAGR